MQIYEYQVKKIFDNSGLPILKGAVAYTPKEAYEIAKSLSGPYIVKAQIPAYLRGKGSFVDTKQRKSGLRTVLTPKQAEKEAAAMLFKHLKTPLTGDKAFEVKKVYVEEMKESIARYKLEIAIDFDSEKIFLIATDLNPDKKTKKPIKVEIRSQQNKISEAKALSIASKLGVRRGLQKKMTRIIQSLYEIFLKYQAFEVNIDPLIITPENKMFVMSGKITFDPDTIEQNKNVHALLDLEEETPNETQARLNNFRYIKLKGNIGCILNGSGLGMATLDLFRQLGGKPSCFLDMGGEPTKDTTIAAFKAVLSEPDVEGILVNIFGATTRCDIVAEGLVSAAREISVGMPVVVRLVGTNEQMAERILFESGLPFIVKRQMDEAVKDVISAVEEIS